MTIVISIVVCIIIALVSAISVAIFRATQKLNAEWRSYAASRGLEYSSQGDRDLEKWIANTAIFESSIAREHKTQNALFGKIRNVPSIACLHGVWIEKSDGKDLSARQTLVILQTDGLPQSYDKSFENDRIEGHVRGNRLVVFRPNCEFTAVQLDGIVDRAFEILEDAKSQVGAGT